MGEGHWGCRGGWGQSFRDLLSTLRGLDTIWRAERMRSGARSFPLVSREDGPQEVGLKVGSLTKRVLPGAGKESLGLGCWRAGGWREMSGFVKVLEVELVTYCCVINHPQTFRLKTTTY